MSFIEAVLLGLVQGLTEFLPISSTGHLTLAGRMMNLISADHPEKWTAFIAVIQIGTLLSVIIYFWKDIVHIVTAFLNDNLKERKGFSEQSLDSKMGWFIVIGTIPVVIIGLAFKDFIEGAFTKNLVVIAISLIVLAIILAIAEKTAKHTKEMKDVTIKDALIVGIAQCFALIPGSSRSGTTITGGLFAGLNRETAARFSFLLSMPAVFASGVLQFRESIKYLDKAYALDMAVATVVAGISGYLAIDFLLKFLRKNTTFVFIWYRIALGIIILALVITNYIQP